MIPPIPCGIGENVEQVAGIYLDADEANPLPFDREGLSAAMTHLLGDPTRKAVAVVAVRAKVTGTWSVVETLGLKGSVLGSLEPNTTSFTLNISGVRHSPARVHVTAQTLGHDEVEVIVHVEQDLYGVPNTDVGYNQTQQDLYWVELCTYLPSWVERHLSRPRRSRTLRRSLVRRVQGLARA